MRNDLGLLSSSIEFLPLLQVVALYKYPMTSEDLMNYYLHLTEQSLTITRLNRANDLQLLSVQE